MTTCPIEDRVALQDLTIAYAHAVDSMHDLDGIVACFTPDASFDLSGIGMATVEGHDGIRGFFAGAFAANAHHAHYLSNFAVTACSGDTASVRTYVTGMGRGKDGSAITVHGRYYFDAVRTAEGWRFRRYWMDFLMPPG
ncbi:MAG: nuclear transport factor 2 family protein [Sphingomonadales bacterium]|nr:nuclear transport factor 2 family protein [Sphingomonadales bacterium]